MARTILTTHPLVAKTGVTPVFSPIDTLNLMQTRNSGVEVVVVKTGAAGALTLRFPSTPDAFGRTGDIVVTMGANAETYFGPFSPANIWGDGASQLFIDPSALAGTASIAVVSPI